MLSFYYNKKIRKNKTMDFWYFPFLLIAIIRSHRNWHRNLALVRMKALKILNFDRNIYILFTLILDHPIADLSKHELQGKSEASFWDLFKKPMIREADIHLEFFKIHSFSFINT